jgi:P27 family predicted phage terminase small subunit
MKPGRHPTPTHLKVIRGNPGKRKLNTQEPKPVGDLKNPPAHFEADEELRDVWNYAIEHSPPGLLKMIDASVLETWCTAHVLHRRALAEVRKHGLLVKAPNTGLPIQSPYLPVVNKQALIMLRAIDHLGFSPASRTRIMTGELPLGALAGWEDVATG